MSVIARKSIRLDPSTCATLELWTCLTCEKTFGIVTFVPLPSTKPLPPPEPTNTIPKACPHCGAQFDRWIP